MSEAAKRKISLANKNRKLSEEDNKRKSEYMKQHPEAWNNNLKPELGPISRIGTHHTEETKQKISNSRRKK